jgi:hypothetical protein
MIKTVRMLALTGVAVATGLSLGVAPASATPAAPASASVQADHKNKPSKQRFIGYYRNGFSCEKAGKVGKIHRKWDNFDCDRVRRGIHRNQYSLTASWERHISPQRGPRR